MFLLFFIYIYCVFCALANLKTTRPSKMQDNPSFPKIMANWAHLWFIVWFTWFSNLTRKNCFTYVSAKHKCWKTGRKHQHMTSHILLGFNTWFLHVFYKLSFFCTKKNKKILQKTAWQQKTLLKTTCFYLFLFATFLCGSTLPRSSRNPDKKMHWKSTWPQKIKNEKKIKVIYFCFLLSKCSTVQQKSSSFIKIN